MVDMTFPSFAQSGLKIIGDFLTGLVIPMFPNSYFRGHASDTWELKCSAFRNGNAGIHSDLELESWKGMARRFVPSGSHTNLEYLVLAQHFGIPTCLLDWTSNPLIALYFACEEDAQMTPGVVYQISAQPIPAEKLQTTPIFDHDRQAYLAIDTSTMNIRSTAQDSMMTLHGPDENSTDANQVYKIQHHDKQLVSSALRLFGITPERVYADLGVAADVFKKGLELNAAVRREFTFVPGTEPPEGFPGEA